MLALLIKYAGVGDCVRPIRLGADRAAVVAQPAVSDDGLGGYTCNRARGVNEHALALAHLVRAACVAGGEGIEDGDFRLRKLHLPLFGHHAHAHTVHPIIDIEVGLWVIGVKEHALAQEGVAEVLAVIEVKVPRVLHTPSKLGGAEALRGVEQDALTLSNHVRATRISAWGLNDAKVDGARGRHA